MKYEYVPVKNIYYMDNETLTRYGIAVIDNTDQDKVIIYTFSDLCADIANIRILADKCNASQPEIMQFEEMIEDYLS